MWTQLDGVVVERGEAPIPLPVLERKRKGRRPGTGPPRALPCAPGGSMHDIARVPDAGLRPLIYGSSAFPVTAREFRRCFTPAPARSPATRGRPAAGRDPSIGPDPGYSRGWRPLSKNPAGRPAGFFGTLA